MRRAFTLIELLVVIGILAVLMGILLPALAMARRHAQSVAGSANLRSLTQIMLMYTNDNGDAFLNPFGSGCAGEAPCPFIDCTDVFDSSKELDEDCCRVWDFCVPTAQEFSTEYFAYYWYSYLGIRDGLPVFREEQAAPADTHLRGLRDQYADSRYFTGADALWPTSFLYSPTFWCSVDRYQPGEARQTNENNRFGKTQYHSSVGFPSSKVLLFERLDFEQRERMNVCPEENVREGRPPAWNNLGARTAVSVVDGSVEEVGMSDLYAAASDWESRLAPIGVGRMPDAPPLLLTKDNNPAAVGGGSGADGEYPLFFWATAFGVEGRDLAR